MGLAVVNGMAENNIGAGLVGSESEKGTTVTVYFPSVGEDIIPEAAL